MSATDMSERVTDAEAIAWFEGELELAERIRATRTHPGSKESSARLVARCAALLALARDGARFRALQERGRDCGRPVYVGPKLGTPSAESHESA
jgi:hypothetical protein